MAGENEPKRCKGIQNRALQRLGSSLEMWSKLVVNCERSGVQFGNILASSCASHRFFASSGLGKQRKNMEGYSKSRFSKLALEFRRIWIRGRFEATRRSICTCLEPFGGHFVANLVPPGPSWAPSWPQDAIWNDFGDDFGRVLGTKLGAKMAPKSIKNQTQIRSFVD